MRDDIAGLTAEQKLRQTPAAMGGHDDEITRSGLRGLEDAFRGMTFRDVDGRAGRLRAWVAVALAFDRISAALAATAFSYS